METVNVRRSERKWTQGTYAHKLIVTKEERQRDKERERERENKQGYV